MLYYFQDSVHWMLGTESLKERKDFEKHQKDQAAQQILKYIYFVYCKDAINPYSNLLPTEKKEFVVEVNELLKSGKNIPTWAEIEAMPAVKELIDRYLWLTYTPNERARLVYLEKIEKYLNQLKDPTSTLEMEKEANEGIKIFRTQLSEITVEIEKDRETGQESSSALHLFELPSSVKRFYEKIGQI